METVTASLIDLLFLFMAAMVMVAVVVAILLMIYGLFFKNKD